MFSENDTSILFLVRDFVNKENFLSQHFNNGKEAMDPIEKDISVTFDNDEVKRRKRKAETTVDNIHVSDKQIDSLCRPAVEGENAPQISPTIKKAKKSLRKQTNTSPVLDIDMDVNNSSREQKHTSCSPKAANNLQNNSKYPTTVKKAMKPLKKQTKTTLPLNNEGDACGELKQKQNGQSPCSKAVNRGSQVDSTDGQTYLTTRKKRAVGSPRASDQDMDVNNSSLEQKHTSCSPKAANNLQNTSKNPTTAKKAKKPLKKQTKTTLPLNNEAEKKVVPKLLTEVDRLIRLMVKKI
uniref:Uncharacterized protein n=1 Tax=Magallana gigas TaxID=29159 RepID=A0A8W8NNR5_MAGGI